EGVVPDPSNPPTGCNLHPRCPYAQEICKEEEPPLKLINEGKEQYAACHFAEELDLAGYSDLIEKKA
ncbi:MAG: oligopeptide/dipeptide ABC transporter ATP-binding protein, partial [Halanaerobium sp.]